MRNRHQHCLGCGCHDSRQDRFIEPSIILLLWEKPCHGYELLNELPSFGFYKGAADQAAVYRTLRHLEEHKLVESEWDVSGVGPARRLYRLTQTGREYLHTWTDVLRQRRDALSGFLSKYQNVSGVSIQS
ncbi:helix-turn-helix transcriptional regulator [candidate division KSB1 bacterium]|nr:helix-turn-helix transcriptional regulator [candidate division KSB1 bacterium]